VKTRTDNLAAKLEVEKLYKVPKYEKVNNPDLNPYPNPGSISIKPMGEILYSASVKAQPSCQQVNFAISQHIICLENYNREAAKRRHQPLIEPVRNLQSQGFAGWPWL
jgi:hypothetical protein